MSDAFFDKLFGDSEPTHLGSGWVSGVSSVFFGMLGLGGVPLPDDTPLTQPLLSESAPNPRTIVEESV